MCRASCVAPLACRFAKQAFADRRCYGTRLAEMSRGGASPSVLNLLHKESCMNNIIYLVGLVVVVIAIISFVF